MDRPWEIGFRHSRKECFWAEHGNQLRVADIRLIPQLLLSVLNLSDLSILSHTIGYVFTFRFDSYLLELASLIIVSEYLVFLLLLFISVLVNAENIERIRMKPPHYTCTIHTHWSKSRIVIKPLQCLHSAHMLTENVILWLLSLIKSHYINTVAISTSKQMTTIWKFYLFAAFEIYIYVWDLLQVACINVHNPHSI